MIVTTSNRWIGLQGPVAPQWITNISWSEGTVSADLTRQSLTGARPYDSRKQLNRMLEMGIHEHYGRPVYRAADLPS